MKSRRLVGFCLMVFVTIFFVTSLSFGATLSSEWKKFTDSNKAALDAEGFKSNLDALLDNREKAVTAWQQLFQGNKALMASANKYYKSILTELDKMIKWLETAEASAKSSKDKDFLKKQKAELNKFDDYLNKTSSEKGNTYGSSAGILIEVPQRWDKHFAKEKNSLLKPLKSSEKVTSLVPKYNAAVDEFMKSEQMMVTYRAKATDADAQAKAEIAKIRDALKSWKNKKLGDDTKALLKEIDLGIDKQVTY